MKIKTNKLIGRPLDYTVAKCEGLNIEFIGVKNDDDPIKFWPNAGNQNYQFSTSWAICGSIIERERITLHTADETLWSACLGDPFGAKRRKGESLHSYIGPTPRIAAMRCYVASKLGDEIDIPEELA